MTQPDDFFHDPRRDPDEPDAAPEPPPDDLPGAAGRYDDLDALVQSYQRRTPEEIAAEQARTQRARDRIEARRSRRTAQASAAAPKVKRAAPAGDAPRFRLPRLPISRTGLYVIGSVLFVALVVFVLGRIRNNPIEAHPNAIWIGTEWTYAPQEDFALAELALRLREHQIGTVYAWVSWLQADGTWRGVDNFETVKAFVRQFKAAYPDSILLGWVSLPVEGTGIAYRLDNAELQQQVADFSARVVTEFGFDGVFLNIEPVWNGDENFLNLLRRVRTAVGTETFVSAAIPPDWSPAGAAIPVPPLIVPGTEWSVDYKQSVALLVDELAVMAYNSGLDTAENYAQWVAYQVQAFAGAVADLGAGTEIVIGMPTYDAEPPGHDPLVENIVSASAGLIDGLLLAGEAAQFVRGAAIYAYWTTDETEWRDFAQSWVNR